jgi:hypothetical protein
MPGMSKYIFIFTDDDMHKINDDYSIKIDLINSKLIMTDEKGIINKINNKLNELHYKLKIKYGNLNDELPEQKMTLRYLKGDAKVLEIGGNIGRNSLIIASILDNDKN